MSINGIDIHVHSPVTQVIMARHSTRAFKPDVAVPLHIVEQCLELAQLAPSSSNVQPWSITIVSGDALEKLRAALFGAFERNEPRTVSEIPKAFQHHRSALGHQLYGIEGYNIPREDKAAHRAASGRNYKFFDAPLVAVVGLDKSLAAIDVLSTGLYLEALLLLLNEKGLSSCVSVSTAEYPEVVRRELNLDENLKILCMLFIGYEDGDHCLSKMRTPRQDWRKNVQFISSVE